MPVYRDKDGNIVEEKTVVNRDLAQDLKLPGSEDKTVVARGPAQSSPQNAGDQTVKSTQEPHNDMPMKNDFYDQATVVNKKSGSAHTAIDDEATRVFRKKVADDDTGEEETGAMSDPVVGWLVVVEGEGQGEYLKLGYGMNSIGRSDTDRISLNFGDNSISRERHAVLTYDSRKRTYYLQQGEGKTLTYVDDEPVLQPTSIQSGCVIDLGETKLMFIALCSSSFDWQD